MNKWYIITPIVVALIIGGSLIKVQGDKQESIERIQLAELNYQKEQDEKKESAESLRKFYLASCLSGAEDAYNENWDSMCDKLGRAKSCLLPRYNADSINESRENQKDDCFKRYK